MTCRYAFVLELYHTMSKACHNCPLNITDCARPHCVGGDGAPKSILTANRMVPGPAIHVSTHLCSLSHILVTFIMTTEVLLCYNSRKASTKVEKQDIRLEY